MKKTVFNSIVSCVQGKRKKRKRENKPDSKPEGKGPFSSWLALFGFFFPSHIREERKIVGTNSEGFIFLAELKPNLTLHISSVIFFPPFFLFLREFCPSLALTNSFPCFYTLTSSLWGSLLIVVGMSAIVQSSYHGKLAKKGSFSLFSAHFVYILCCSSFDPCTHTIRIMLWTSCFSLLVVSLKKGLVSNFNIVLHCLNNHSFTSVGRGIKGLAPDLKSAADP